jgi:hypothetical protein
VFHHLITKNIAFPLIAIVVFDGVVYDTNCGCIVDVYSGLHDKKGYRSPGT